MGPPQFSGGYQGDAPGSMDLARRLGSCGNYPVFTKGCRLITLERASRVVAADIQTLRRVALRSPLELRQEMLGLGVVWKVAGPERLGLGLCLLAFGANGFEPVARRFLISSEFPCSTPRTFSDATRACRLPLHRSSDDL